MLDRFPRLTIALIVGLILGVIVADRWFFVTRVAPKIPEEVQAGLMSIFAVGLLVLFLIERRRMARGGRPIDLTVITQSAGYVLVTALGGSILYWLAGYRVVAAVAAVLILGGFMIWAIRRRQARD